MAHPDPVVIAPSKRAYAATLEDACRDLGITDESQRERLRALAGACSLSAYTLISNLASDNPPEWQTIKALHQRTRIPLCTWFLRLGLFNEEDIAAALAYDEPPELLSELQQRALDLVEGLPDAAGFDYIDFWERTPGLAGHKSGAPRSVRRRKRRAEGSR